MKKSTIIGICASAVAFVAILLVATFYDLQINIALGNANSFFGQFFRLWGEAIGWIVIPIAAGILMRASNRKMLAGKILTGVWAAVMLVGWFLTIRYFLEEFTGDSYIESLYGSPYKWLTVHSVVLAIIASGINAWAAFRIKEENVGKLVFFAVVLIIALALSQLVTTVLKNIWTRQRFRNLDIGNGGTSSEGFTPWYQPGLGKNKAAATYYVEDSAGMPKSDAYKSFPSGHTSAAALTLSIVVIPELFEKVKKYKVWFWICPIVFTVLVAISRMVNRAHYLSDVLFGGTIGALSVFAAIALTKLIRKAETKNRFFKKAALAMGAEPHEEEPTEEPTDEQTEEPLAEPEDPTEEPLVNVENPQTEE